MKYKNQILCGHTLGILKQFPDEIFDTIITSPPYWGLRDYGVEEQIGLEPTLDLYLSHLWQITDELKRVLKKTGVMYWNHGDCYGGSGCGKGDYRNMNKRSLSKTPLYADKPNPQLQLKAKCLAMQNYRLVLGMIDRDWILRNTIIWNKPNHMPSSVKDRFTSSYEPVFMLTKNNKPQYYYNTKTGLMADKQPKKSVEGVDWDWKKGEDSWQRPSRDETFKTPSRQKSTYAIAKRKKVSYWKSIDYWFDLDAVRQPHTVCGVTDHRPMGVLRQKLYPGSTYNKSNDPHLKQFQYRNKTQNESYKKSGMRNAPEPGEPNAFNPSGKNPGDVWTIPTQPFPEAHFATFPEKLIEPMILSSCPQWICKKCGKARVRIVEPSEEYKKRLGKSWHEHKEDFTQGNIRETGHIRTTAQYQTIGWSDCGCNAGWRAGIVLDPFIGSGTTGLVAKKLGRDYTGIELNPEYKKMADKRLMAIPDSLFK